MISVSLLDDDVHLIKVQSLWPWHTPELLVRAVCPGPWLSEFVLVKVKSVGADK